MAIAGVAWATPPKAARIESTMRVLMLGQHDELTSYRVHAMEGAGIEVIHPNSRKEALRSISGDRFDVAVLSYTLDSDTAHELSELIRQNCPTCPLIAIMESAWQDSKIQSDEIVVGKEGPEALIEAIQRASKKGLRRIK